MSLSLGPTLPRTQEGGSGHQWTFLCLRRQFSCDLGGQNWFQLMPVAALPWGRGVGSFGVMLGGGQGPGPASPALVGPRAAAPGTRAEFLSRSGYGAREATRRAAGRDAEGR